jgi:acyl-CoA reductase-like NAD-dependent aldehyde dehydrogenase
VNLIDGRWCDALDGRGYTRVNPARPGDVVGRFPDSGPADATAAVQAASRACPAWRDAAATACAEVLRQAGELVAGRRPRWPPC